MADLIIVPTAGEMTALSRRLKSRRQTTGWAFQLCGFGPIAAAARTAALISRYRPSRVLLAGIAGTFDENRFPIGTACRFDLVSCYGIGVGSGEHFQSAQSLGWDQFSGGDARPKVTDEIALISTFVGDIPCHGQLLTACAASANQLEADQRRRLFPAATAEDMEGFGVAMACALAGVPLQIVRGISNLVGDRKASAWKVDAALEAAAELVIELLPWRWIPTES